jgi:hypothetical protein
MNLEANIYDIVDLLRTAQSLLCSTPLNGLYGEHILSLNHSINNFVRLVGISHNEVDYSDFSDVLMSEEYPSIEEDYPPIQYTQTENNERLEICAQCPTHATSEERDRFLYDTYVLTEGYTNLGKYSSLPGPLYSECLSLTRPRFILSSKSDQETFENIKVSEAILNIERQVSLRAQSTMNHNVTLRENLIAAAPCGYTVWKKLINSLSKDNPPELRTDTVDYKDHGTNFPLEVTTARWCGDNIPSMHSGKSWRIKKTQYSNGTYVTTIVNRFSLIYNKHFDWVKIAFYYRVFSWSRRDNCYYSTK